MLTLGINTATSTTAIALLNDQKIITKVSWPSNNNEAENIMPAIKDMLDKEDLKFANIKNIIVVKGPGSFTGLRIGVATANTIAHLINANLYAISTFEYLWQSAPHASALLVYGGSGGVYVSLNKDQEGILINMPDINEYLNKNNVTSVFGDITQDQISQINTQFTKIDFDFASTLSKLNMQSLKKETLVSPLYIKKPGITESKKFKCST